MDSACGAFVNALAAQFTLIEIDISEVIFEGNGIERTSLGALTAADTSGGTVLASDSTFITAHTGYEDATVFRAFVTEFEKVFRAFFDAGATSGTFFFVDNGETGLWIHGESAEGTDTHAIAFAEASEGTACFTGIERGFDDTGFGTVIEIGTWTVCAGAVTAENGNHRCAFRGSFTETVADIFHNGRTAYRTEYRRDIIGINGSGS